MLPDATLATGFVLGAIVSPPDVVAAIAVIRGLRVPKRIVTVLEGESLINDATGLILYKFAVAAVVTGHFSAAQAGVHFLWMVACGTGIGLAIGVIILKLIPRIRELPVQILMTFVAPYSAYLLTEAVEGSGVLAVVALGLYVGWNSPSISTPHFRIPAQAVWKMVTFVLDSLVFLLIGLKVPSLLVSLSVYSTGELVRYTAITCATAVLVRFVWVFAVAHLTRILFPAVRRNDPLPGWQNLFVIAFIGMRGVVSLATALALPVYIGWGAPFPYRDLITFLALGLIVVTLAVQGLMLPWLLRRLTLTFDPRILQEDWNARMNAARQALAKIEEIEKGGQVHSAALDRIRGHYLTRLESLGDGPNTPITDAEMPAETTHPLLQEENRLWQDVIAIEREVVLGMRRAYEIGDSVMHDMLHDLDLLATRFTG
jgi:CPA1 family monovalent cation:H+ antiporter